MAVRLNVVMNQTPPANASAQRLGEEIVGEMIGRPGIDMVLVSAASLDDPQTTDYLTVESLSGDFVYLDWKTPAASIEMLARCHIQGRRAPHANDQNASFDAESTVAPSTRRIYVFDLNGHSSGGTVCRAVMDLLSLRQIRTFSLGMQQPGAATRVPAARSSVMPAAKIEPMSIVADTAGSTTAGPPNGGRVSSRALTETEIDRLVDQLNADELD